jgi:hypothetical protein
MTIGHMHPLDITGDHPVADAALPDSPARWTTFSGGEVGGAVRRNERAAR